MTTLDPQSTQKLGKAIPENYRKGARFTWHQRRRHRAVLSLLKQVTGNVLDYGCGYGDLTLAIARTHPVTGCDVDPDRVEFAKSEYGPLEFVICQGNGTPFYDESFAIIVSAVVIHFVKEPTGYLQEIRRLLRPGGHLLIVFKCMPVVRNRIRRLLGRGDAKSRLWVRPLDQYQALLRETGFQVVGSTWFYDPPFEGWKNASDCIFGVIEQVLSMFRVKGAAGYHAFLARKVDL